MAGELAPSVSALAEIFQIRTAPAFIMRKLSVIKMAVTEIRSDNPVLGLIDSVPTEDALLLRKDAGILLSTWCQVTEG